MDMIPADFNDLWSANRERQNKAFSDVLAVTASHVDWTYDVWDQVVANLTHKALLVNALESRFQACSSEKNCTLIRYDISQSLRKLYDAVKDETVKAKALALIETEPDSKYRKKYAGLWRATGVV